MRASDNLKLFNKTSTSFCTCDNLFSNQSIANFSFCAFKLDSILFSQPCINLSTFQSLLLKLRPCSSADSSNKISLPAGDDIIIPNLTASAPYTSMSANKSGELPRLLLIFRPCLSLTIPVKYTCSNGF